MGNQDLFHHPPVSIDFVPQGLAIEVRRAQSRCVMRDRLLVEVDPPVAPASDILGKYVSFCLKLRPGEAPVQVNGFIRRIMAAVRDPEGRTVSILGVRLMDVAAEAQAALDRFVAYEEVLQREPRARRMPVRFPVEFQGLDVFGPCQAIDLSLTGMFLNTKGRLPVGKDVRLGFRLPFQKEAVALDARVIWAGQKPSRTGGAVEGMGVAFTNVPDPTRAALERYWSRLAGPIAAL